MASSEPQRHELEQYLIRRLVDGMAGWAAFYQACRPSRHYDEHLFYQHVEAIAAGRKWQVSQQHALAGPRRRGAPSTIDFVFSRTRGETKSRPGLIFLEVKYLRGSNPSQELAELRKDIEKLRRVEPANLVSNRRILKCGPAAKFLLVFAQEAALATLGSCASRTNGSVAKMVRKARNGKQRNIYHASLGTYLHDELEWVVIGIGEPSWPQFAE